MTDQEFREERRKGIGGSDAHHLLNIAPYGCERRLWMEKRGVEPDYPVVESGPMKRGKALEALIAAEYSVLSGRRLADQSSASVNHSPYPYNVHVDFWQVADGVFAPILVPLECKTASREVFQKMLRDGLPESYILQMQTYLMVNGCEWGTFAVLWPDGWELKWFDVPADPAIQARIDEEAQKFWALVENGPSPERLSPKSPQCGRCPYRTSCQGDAMLEAVSVVEGERMPFLPIGDLIQEYIETRDLFDQAEGLLEDVKGRIREAMGDTGIALAPGARVRFKPVEVQRYDVKVLVEQYSLLRTAYFDLGEKYYGIKPGPNVMKSTPPASDFKRRSVSRPLYVEPR